MKSVKDNFIYNSIYQILNILVPLITTPYLTRVLGASGLGEFSYSYSVAYYFVICMKLGLDNYGNRKIASIREDRNTLSRTFREIYYCQLICSIVAIIGYIVFVVMQKEKLMFLIMLPYVFSGMLDINWLFYGLEEFKLTTTRNIIIKILTTLCILLLVKNENDVYIYSVIMTISTLVSQLCIWPFVFKIIEEVKVPISDSLKHFKENIILFVPIIAVSLYKIMAKIMLGNMTNTSEVGYYDSSEKIIQIPLVLITSLGTVMLPRMSNLYSNSKNDEASKILEKSIEAAMFLSTALGFGIMAVANTFVPWYYGPDFGKCVYLFQILLPSCIFLAFANVIRTQYIVPNRKDRIFILSVSAGAIVNLIVNAICIPKMASIGAAIGTLIAEVIVCVVQVFSVRKELDIKKYLLSSIKYILAGMVMYVLVLNMDFKTLPVLVNLLLQVVIGCLIYLMCLAITLFLKKNASKINNEKD